MSTTIIFNTGPKGSAIPVRVEDLGDGTFALAMTSTGNVAATPLPWQYVLADVSGAGSTVRIEVYDVNGVVVPFVGSDSTKYGAVSFAIGANAKTSIGFAILSGVTVNGSAVNIPVLPSGVVGARVSLLGGQTTYNTAGTTDGGSGGGNGVLASLAGPNTDSPVNMFPNDIFTFGRKI